MLVTLLFLGGIAIVGYVSVFEGHYDVFLKVSLLFFIYNIISLLPFICEIKNNAPTIFNICCVLLLSWIYIIIPNYMITFYENMAMCIAPIYVVIECLQIMGLIVIISDYLTEWLSSDNDDINEASKIKKLFVVSITFLGYLVSYFVLFNIYQNRESYIVSQGLSFNNTFNTVVGCMITVVIFSILFPVASITQSSLISLFHSYLFYALSFSYKELSIFIFI